MATLFLLISLVFFQHFLVVKSGWLTGKSSSSQRLVPAMYIFGDCQVDSGINPDLNIISSTVNYYPYGIDFPIGSTGRFSNGGTIADFLAEAVGLQVCIHYSPTQSSSNSILTGYNYASGPAGILPETGTAFGLNWSMDKQVAVFNMTVRNNLPKHFNSTAKLSEYLAKSLFVIATGTSDYRYSYMQPDSYNSSRRYDPIQYATLLVNRLGTQLKELYVLGARKFLVFEIVPLGCYPAALKVIKPNTRCAEEVNNLAFLFNQKLEHKLRTLESTHKDATFTIAKTYNLITDLVEKPLHGFFETRKPCCPVREDIAGLCLKHSTPCEDRNTTLFWDDSHLTEAANKIIVDRCFSGSDVCKPNLFTTLTSAAKPRTRPCSVHLLFLLMISAIFLLSQEYWILQFSTFAFVPSLVKTQL